MKKVVGFTYKAQKEDFERAKKCLDLLNVEYDIFNIPQFRVEKNIQDNQVVFTFGAAAKLAAETYIKETKVNAKLVSLPHLKSLRPTEQNKEHRDLTSTILKAEGDFLASNVSDVCQSDLTIDDLPDLTHQHILLLKKMVEDRGDDTCLQVAKNGKKILIGQKPCKDIEHDIFISFEELYTVRQAMDILGVEAVHVVKRH